MRLKISYINIFKYGSLRSTCVLTDSITSGCQGWRRKKRQRLMKRGVFIYNYTSKGDMATSRRI